MRPLMPSRFGDMAPMSAELLAGRYYGQTSGSVRYGDLLLTECVYAPELRISKHSHKNPYLLLTLEGSQSEDYGRRSRLYKRSTLAFHPAHESHSQCIGPDGLRCLHVEFIGKWAERNPGIAGLLEKQADFDRGPLLWLSQRVYGEFRNRDDLSGLATEGLILELLAEFARATSEKTHHIPRWLADARSLMHGRHRESLALSVIAESVGVHPVHLAREFRKHFRSTVAEYLRRLRIESACNAIAGSNVPLADIAAQVGFSDQAHFTRVFRA